MLWAYCGATRISGESLVDVLATASRFAAIGLVNDCEHLLASNLDADNAADIAPYALFYDRPLLLDCCVAYGALLARFDPQATGAAVQSALRATNDARIVALVAEWSAIVSRWAKQ